MIYGPYETSYITNEQFQRDPSCNKINNINRDCIVIGLGGIGGHVADILGSLQHVDSIILFDDDIIELKNLNRTIYSYRHIGKYKVEAMSEIISSRNCGPIVISINAKFNKETCDKLNSEDFNIQRKIFSVFDCRDDYFGDYDLLNSLKFVYQYNLVRAAYNGMSVTIDPNPKDHPVWGQGGYTENMSHSFPSRLAALLAIICEGSRECNEDTLYNNPITFNSENLFRIITDGVKLNNMTNIEDRDKIMNSLYKE